MKPVLLLVHGWGFDASFWTPLRTHLAEDALAWDLGYFGAPSDQAVPAGRPVVAVGHSFGMLWLLHRRPTPLRALVSINGFSCFARRENYPQGIAPRLLTRMQAQCAESPARVVGDFRARCGEAAPAPAAPQRERLLAGLESLAAWDERPAVPDLALCGRSDPLIDAAMTRACFPEKCLAWHEGGHLLPQEDPGWCAAQLRQLLARLA
jgi:pimeloyl-[acyl-carrier protein] methyl ester esterase